MIGKILNLANKEVESQETSTEIISDRDYQLGLISEHY